MLSEAKYLDVQIHDELVIEVADECKDQGAKLLKKCMQEAWDLSVPLAVQLRQGKSWGEMTVIDHL